VVPWKFLMVMSEMVRFDGNCQIMLVTKCDNIWKGERLTSLQRVKFF
jgi:hypothetical protein